MGNSERRKGNIVINNDADVGYTNGPSFPS